MGNPGRLLSRGDGVCFQKHIPAGLSERTGRDGSQKLLHTHDHTAQGHPESGFGCDAVGMGGCELRDASKAPNHTWNHPIKTPPTTRQKGQEVQTPRSSNSQPRQLPTAPNPKRPQDGQTEGWTDAQTSTTKPPGGVDVEVSVPLWVVRQS